MGTLIYVFCELEQSQTLENKLCVHFWFDVVAVVALSKMAHQKAADNRFIARKHCREWTECTKICCIE